YRCSQGGKPLLRRDHGVLRRVSPTYPPPQGTFDTITRPSATVPGRSRFSFDLHALTMPTAFNLSQDQTLQFLFVAPACAGLLRKKSLPVKTSDRADPMRSHG